MGNIEKMNVYIVTKDKATKSDKNGKWFNNLFLPLFKSSKDPLKKIPKVDDYWNEIRNVLLGKKKNSNLKIIKHKDIKFIAFPVANNQVLVFAIGTEKSEALNDIYKLTQEKSECMNYTKFLKLIRANDTEAIKNNYDNLVQQNISDKDIKEWGYKNLEEMLKITSQRSDFDFEHAYCCGRPLGTSIALSNWSLKEWAKEINNCMQATSNADYKKEYLESINEQEIGNEQSFGKWIIENYCKFWISDYNKDMDCTFEECINYYGNKEVYSNLNTIYKVIGTFYNKNNNDSKDSKLFTLIKKTLNQWGDVKKVDEVKIDENTRRVNIQIVTTYTDEEMWDIINKNVKPLFSDKFDVEVEETSLMDKHTILCPVLLIKLNKDIIISKNDIKSLAEIEHNFITGLINYEDAVNAILDIGEADSNSDAQAIVDAWELKNKKDTGRAESHKFKIYLYNVDEPIDQLEKLEHHFDYLYGDTNPGDYWNIKVSDNSDGNVVISGEISGVSENDFKDYIEDGLEQYDAELDDIEWY